MKMHSLKLLGMAALTTAMVGCTSNYQSDSLMAEPMKTTAKAIESFKVGAGDVIEVRVWRAPELSVSGPIRSDGMFALPLVGSLEVAGLTPEEIKTQVEEKLTEYVASPEVTVIVASTASDEFTNRVRVTGAVESPQSLVWREDMTVMDLVLLAGGTNDFAAPQKTLLYRKTADGVVAYPVMLNDIFYGGKLDTNYSLLPSDIVTVPESQF